MAGPGRAYDVCMLGLGDDAHTASFFPGSPLLADATDPAADVLPAREAEEWFAAIATADKGWRLTVTPAGLRACGLVVVMTFGAAKAPALRRVFHGAYEPTTTPAQILRACAARVVWLVDPAAAAGLETA